MSTMKITNNLTDYLHDVFAEFKSDLQKGHHDLIISGCNADTAKTSGSIPCHRLAVAAKSPFLAEVLKELSDVDDVRIIVPGADCDFIDSLSEVIYEPQWKKHHQVLLESSGLCTPCFIDKSRSKVATKKKVEKQKSLSCQEADDAEEAVPSNEWNNKVSLKFSQREFVAIGGRVTGEYNVSDELKKDDSVPKDVESQYSDHDVDLDIKTEESTIISYDGGQEDTERAQGTKSDAPFDHVYLPCKNDTKMTGEKVSSVPGIIEAQTDKPRVTSNYSRLGGLSKKIFNYSLVKQNEGENTLATAGKSVKSVPKKRIVIVAKHHSLKPGDKKVILISSVKKAQQLLMLTTLLLSVLLASSRLVTT